MPRIEGLSAKVILGGYDVKPPTNPTVLAKEFRRSASSLILSGTLTERLMSQVAKAPGSNAVGKIVDRLA